jgi:hypothetical protein
LLRRNNYLGDIWKTEPKLLNIRIDVYPSKPDIATVQRSSDAIPEMVMRASIPLYDGDSIIHYSGAVALPSTVRSAPPRKQSLWGAVTSKVSGFFLWLERSAERARYRELERFLGEATDVCDLERRIRDVEQSRGGLFDPYS